MKTIKISGILTFISFSPNEQGGHEEGDAGDSRVTRLFQSALLLSLPSQAVSCPQSMPFKLVDNELVAVPFEGVI